MDDARSVPRPAIRELHPGGTAERLQGGSRQKQSNSPSLEQHAVSPTPPSGGNGLYRERVETRANAGPLPAIRSFPQAAIQSNRIGVIPKGQTGKWRLITDLSYPPGHTV